MTAPRLAKADPLRELSGAPADAPPPVLLGYQQEWIADRSQLKVCSKGRRVGLTWAEAADDVLDAIPDVDACNSFYISAAQDMAREYIEAVALWARAFDVVAGEIEESVFDDGADVADPARRYIKTYEVSFPKTGRRIVALSSRPTNLRGKQGNIILDEAAFAPDLPGLIKAAMAMILWGNRVKIISSHNGTDSAFNTLIEEIKAGKRRGSVHHIPFMRAVGDGLYRRVCLRRGKEWTQQGEDEWVREAYEFYSTDAEEELDAIPAKSGGKYLSLALLAERMTVPPGDERCTIVRGEWDDAFAYLAEDMRRFAIQGWIAERLQPVLKRLDAQRRHVFGLDFARSAHLTVLVVLDEDQELIHRPRLQLELRNCPFTSQDQLFEHVVRALPRWRGGAGDAGGNGAASMEKLAQTFGAEMVEQVKLSQGFYALHMPKLKGALQDGTLTDLPRDEPTRDDLRAIEVIKGIPMVPAVNTLSAAARAAAKEAGAKTLQRHGDSAVAYMLAEYAFRREAGEIGWTPVPARADRWDGGAAQRGRMAASLAEFEADDLAEAGKALW